MEIERIAEIVDKIERRGHGACFHKAGLQRKEESHISKELFSDFMVYQVSEVYPSRAPGEGKRRMCALVDVKLSSWSEISLSVSLLCPAH